MKQIILILTMFATPAISPAQSSYISTAGDMKVDGGIIQEYTSPNIIVVGQYNPLIEGFIVNLRFYDSGSWDSPAGEFTMTLDKATVDGFTGSGTGDTEKAQNALEQAVVDYLEGINGAIFTIN